MRTRPAAGERTFLRLAPILLASIAVVCGCEDRVGRRGTDSGDRDRGREVTVRTAIDRPAHGDVTPPPDEPVLDPPGAQPVDQPTEPVDPSDPMGWSPPEEVGPHGGERQEIEVEIAFSGEFGYTVTDENGTTYHVGDWAMYEDKVYTSEYWGTWPLYFFGTEVGITVTVRNNGPRANARLRIRTEAYVLLTDGSNGAVLSAPRDTDIVVARGESVTVDASFIAVYTPDAESGLDRFIVKVLHPNAGGSRGDDEPALILMKEGILCPPEYQPGAGDEGF